MKRKKVDQIFSFFLINIDFLKTAIIYQASSPDEFALVNKAAELQFKFIVNFLKKKKDPILKTYYLFIRKEHLIQSILKLKVNKLNMKF